MKIKCKACNNIFEEDFVVCGHEYSCGTCCPKCGRDIDIEVNKVGELRARTAGVDKKFEMQEEK